MVDVVQLAEHWIVVPGVVGSSPITHPIKNKDTKRYPCFLYFWGWVMGLEEGGLGAGNCGHLKRIGTKNMHCKSKFQYT